MAWSLLCESWPESLKYFSINNSYSILELSYTRICRIFRRTRWNYFGPQNWPGKLYIICPEIKFWTWTEKFSAITLMIIFNRVDLSVTSNTVQTGFWLPPCLLLFLLQTKLGSSFFSRRGECDDRVTTGTFPALSCCPKTLPKLTALAPSFPSSFRCRELVPFGSL